MKTNSIRMAGGRLPVLVPVLCLGVGLAVGRGTAQEEILLIGPSPGGTLSWTAPPELAGFTVEWAPTVLGPWTNSWAPLSNLPNTGVIQSVQVPVFYRVVGHPRPGVLLHGDGAGSSTEITDARGHGVTARGGVQIDTGWSRFGGGSIRFDGTSGYLDLGTSPDWAFGTGDFTVDLWASFDRAGGTQHIIGLHTSGVYTEWSLVLQGTKLNVYINGVVPISHTWTPVPGQWHHLALTRSQGTLRLFVDGQLVQSVPHTTQIANGRALTVGAANNPSLWFGGSLDEIHLVQGRALWTGSFTLPTEPHPY